MIYIDGDFLTKDEASVSVYDHGLLYGDGIFEGIRIYNGRIFNIERHIQRLFDSAAALNLHIGLTAEEIQDALEKTVEATIPDEREYIRLVVTRGKGKLGISPASCPKATVIIIVDKISLYDKQFYENGLTVITSSVRRNSPDAVNPRIKSLNYLNNIFAKMEAQAVGAQEAIMLNREGNVAECTGDNIFAVKNGIIYTPALTQGCLGGLTRETVIKVARNAGLRVEETTLALYDIHTADEVFLTGTAAMVVPVTTVDNRSIGDGRPGVVTEQILELFKQEINK